MELISAYEAAQLTKEKIKEIELEKSGFTDSIRIVKEKIESAILLAETYTRIQINSDSTYGSPESDALYEDNHDIGRLSDYLREKHYRVEIEDCMWGSGKQYLHISW